jgi:tetrahydromethanopterin S-methyltransferase subunit G
MWQKLKLEKLNITTKQISKPSIATIVETHDKLDTLAIKVDNQMEVIQVQVGKNIIKDVLIDGGTSVNVIIKNLRTKLCLTKPRPTPYHLRMVDQNMTKPLGIIINLKIHIHGIPYIATFIVLENNVVDSNYFMLLGRPWLRDAKVTHD